MAYSLPILGLQISGFGSILISQFTRWGKGLMILDSFVSYVYSGFRIGPMNDDVVRAEREERESLPNHPLSRRVSQLRPALRQMVERKAVPAGEILPGRLGREGLAHRSPARRAVFRLLGEYFPEEAAREILARIHDYKWIEAEKAGFDIWRINGYEPLKIAARTWAEKHLPATVTAIYCEDGEDDEAAA
jgi:hypothetical protein